MITISGFTCRMGNQLFQIAAAYALAQKNNVEFLCPEWQYAQYFSNQFKPYIGEPIEKRFSENGFHYTPIPFEDNLSIDGYFQSAKYFENINVQELFKFKREREVISYHEGYASIHVRRTDYLKYPDHHPLCTLEYYKKAIYLSGYKNFTVFSDDPEWCRKNFKNDEIYSFVFSDGKSDIEDFQFMSQYKCNIISNSTFSWWAAMLNKNPDKLIIAPSKDNWHGVAYKDWNHDDLIPEDWEQIKF